MKRALSDPFAILSIGVLLFLALHGLLQFFEESPAFQLQQAEEDYRTAVKTTLQNVRQEKFNAALKTWQALESQYDPSMGNGKLYANIGTAFFQLQEYPMALLYYYRAKALRPRDEKLASNLAIVQQKAQQEIAKEQTPLQRLFFFHYDFSIPERLQLFALFFVSSLVLASGSIWLRYGWLEKVSLALLPFCVGLLLSLSISYLFDPIEGVLLSAQPLLRGPGSQYAKVTDLPQLAGSKVEMLESVQAGNWIKVKSSTGTIGYVLGKEIQPIGAGL